MRTIITTIAVAVLAIACRKPAEEATAAREEVAEERQDVTEAQREAQKEIADTRKEGAGEIREEQKELTEAQRQAAATSGQPVTVQGTVESVSGDEFALKTSDGEKLDLNFDAATQGQGGQAFSKSAISEGSEIRATYTVRDGDNYAQSVEIVQPGEVK